MVSNTKPKYEKPKFQAADPSDVGDIQIEDVSSIEYHRAWAFYGRAGTGKTTLASTFPGPVLLIDLNDEGTDSVSDVPGLKVIRVGQKGWPMLEAIYWDIKGNPEKYAMFKTIVLDTVTRMQQMCIEAYMAQKGKDVSEAGQWGSMSKAAWGVVASQMKEWLTSYRDLPVHTVFLAQDRESYVDDDDAGRRAGEEFDVLPEIGPSLMKSVAKDLCASVHVIGYTFLREKPLAEGEKRVKDNFQYCVRVGPHPVYSTKMRKPKSIGVPSLIIDPTFTDIFDIIKGQ